MFSLKLVCRLFFGPIIVKGENQRGPGTPEWTHVGCSVETNLQKLHLIVVQQQREAQATQVHSTQEETG